MFSSRDWLLADEPEAAVKGGVADIQKSLIGRRIVPSEGGVLVLKSDDHAPFVAALAAKQMPGPECNNFGTELLQHDTACDP